MVSRTWIGIGLAMTLLLIGCGSNGSDGVGLYESCGAAGECGDGLACMGGICLKTNGCAAAGCDWDTEVCVADRQGGVECVPSCIDAATACADHDPVLMNAHPVVGYWVMPDSDQPTPVPVCACLEDACGGCAANQMCFSLDNDESPEAQDVVTAGFAADFVAAGGGCVPRPD